MNIASVSGSSPVSVPMNAKAAGKPVEKEGDHDGDDKGAAAVAKDTARGDSESKGGNIDLTA
ncbi:MAG: hypothetical protein JF616_07810 [Fibrobacteres bacterium]|nr:hypothetical protein [Fibrobacterota bacterium]